MLDAKSNSINVMICRIHKDLVDPEKLQATLTDGTLNNPCDLKKALEMVTLLEAQLKEMNPNLDSIAEYALLFILVRWNRFFQVYLMTKFIFQIGIGQRSHCTMNELKI